MAELLNENEVRERAARLSGWTVEGKHLQCNRTFKDFLEAIAFVNKLVAPAESAGHHPDITISYNKVTISVTTHDAGGLTEKDFALAKVISDIS